MSRKGFAEARNPFRSGATSSDFLEVVSELARNLVGLVQAAAGCHIANDFQDLFKAKES
jgi:hypothetical protein